MVDVLDSLQSGVTSRFNREHPTEIDDIRANEAD